MTMTTIAPDLRARLDALYEDGWDHFQKFDVEVRASSFHPFVPADYNEVEKLIAPLAREGLRFLEWGSGSGVITIMADLLGFDAWGIELDARLVDVARDLARKHGSHAQFVAASFLPAGYRYVDPDGGNRTGTLGEGPSGYIEMGRALDDFDVVFGYPWHGEEPVMRDVFRKYGSPDANLIIFPGGTRPVKRGW